MSYSLSPDQAWHFVRPDLGPNCLKDISRLDKELNQLEKTASHHYEIIKIPRNTHENIFQSNKNENIFHSNQNFQVFENGSFKKRLEFPYTINNTLGQQLN